MKTPTQGPWEWFIDAYGISLRTTHSGQLVILDSVQGRARIPKLGTLRFADRTDNLGGLMKTAEQFVRSRHDVPGIVEIDNPDARLIRAAPELLSALRAYVEIEEEAAPASSSPLRERARAAISQVEGRGT